MSKATHNRLYAVPVHTFEPQHEAIRGSGDILFPSPDHRKLDKRPIPTLYFFINIISEMEPKM